MDLSIAESPVSSGRRAASALIHGARGRRYDDRQDYLKSERELVLASAAVRTASPID
jgi:hypothetical protein